MPEPKNGPPYPSNTIAPLDLDAKLAAAANDNADPIHQQGQRFRIVIEDEVTGEELLGWGGVARHRAELIAEFIDNRGVPEEKIGRFNRRPNTLFGAQARPRGRK